MQDGHRGTPGNVTAQDQPAGNTAVAVTREHRSTHAHAAYRRWTGALRAMRQKSADSIVKGVQMPAIAWPSLLSGRSDESGCVGVRSSILREESVEQAN